MSEGLYLTETDILLHLKATSIHKLVVVRVEGGGTNYYGVFDLKYGNKLPIHKKMAMDVLDLIKEGKICDVEHSFFKDKKVNFSD